MTPQKKSYWAGIQKTEINYKIEKEIIAFQLRYQSIDFILKRTAVSPTILSLTLYKINSGYYASLGKYYNY